LIEPGEANSIRIHSQGDNSMRFGTRLLAVTICALTAIIGCGKSSLPASTGGGKTATGTGEPHSRPIKEVEDELGNLIKDIELKERELEALRQKADSLRKEMARQTPTGKVPKETATKWSTPLDEIALLAWID
jgi:hypothetical protein